MVMNKNKIMDKLGIVTQRDKVQFIIAGGLMIVGCVLLIIGMFVPPIGVISSSVLIAYGEISTLAASILGIDAIYTNKLQRIVSGMKEISNDINELSSIDEPRTKTNI